MRYNQIKKPLIENDLEKYYQFIDNFDNSDEILDEDED